MVPDHNCPHCTYLGSVYTEVQRENFLEQQTFDLFLCWDVKHDPLFKTPPAMIVCRCLETWERLCPGEKLKGAALPIRQLTRKEDRYTHIAWLAGVEKARMHPRYRLIAALGE